MHWIRTWPGTAGYRGYLNLESCTQLYVDAVPASSPTDWVVYAVLPTTGAVRLDLGVFSVHSDANDVLEQLVESL